MTAMAKRLFVLTAIVLTAFPAMISAQTGTIAGLVRDGTGAVLPGVTVEATSPALIEKVRVAVTDDQGVYKIVDLRPGTYAVTFKLPGFTTLVREGLDLSTGVTVAVNAELRVGALEETITVSGQSPLVDPQNTVQRRTVTRDIIEDLPTGRQWANYTVLVPGVAIVAGAGQDVGGSAGDRTQWLAIHGSNAWEAPREFDGMRYDNIAQTGGSSGVYPVNNAMVQEFDVRTGGAGADADVSGVRVNAIPKQGGNRFSGYFFGNFSNERLIANNLDDDLRARGAPTPSTLTNLFDINPAVGGPLKQDKLWFYASYRYYGSTEIPPGAYYAKDPYAFVFTPDTSRRAVSPSWTHSGNLRGTWQTTPSSRLALYGDRHVRCNPCALGLSATNSWEASRQTKTPNNGLIQGTWNWTATNRLLVEIGETIKPDLLEYHAQPGLPQDGFSVFEQRTGLSFRNIASRYHQRTLQHNGRASVAYVTGSHNLKVGTQWLSGTFRRTFFSTDTMNLLDGVPVALTLRLTPYDTASNLKLNLGAYVQEQWTHERLTLNVGLRFDYVNIYVPQQHIGPSKYVGARDFARIDDVPSWKDISPRLGASYDLFGNAKTALKGYLGRFVEAQGAWFSELVNPAAATSGTTATRAWNDANGNFVPDCDLMNPGTNGECGANNNLNFGRSVVAVRYDPEAANGWNVRSRNWEGMVGIQQELRSGVSADLSYNWRDDDGFGRWVGNRVTDNLLVTPADYDTYCVTAPRDPRLPGGGGYPICGLADIKPGKFGQNDNVITLASVFGKQYRRYDGVDLNVNVRLPGRARLTGGSSIGRVKTNQCFVVDSPQEMVNCAVNPPFQPHVKLSGIYPLPLWGLQTSATYQSIPGPEITASWAVPVSLITPALGRSLAGGARSATVPLVAPATMFNDRMHQVDVRVGKNVKVGPARLQAHLDVYNILNANAVLQQNNTFGSAWQNPTSILVGRMFKFGVQLDF